MAVIHWKTAVSAVFSTAADWIGGIVPGAADDAVLDASGPAYTVTADNNQTVNSLTTASNATLLVANNLSFTMTNGTGTGANAGVVAVGNNSALYLGGTFNNTSAAAGGGLTLNGVANVSELRLLGAITTFTGGGKVVLGTGGNNLIFGNAGAANTLVNVNNTFSGVGNIGDNSLTLVNQTAGVINANQTGGLTLQVNGGVTNTGLLEATNTGGLQIYGTTVDNSGGANAGKISAIGAGAHVDLTAGTYIIGGTLSTSGAGAIIDAAANQNVYLDGSQPGAPINNAGSFVVNNNAAVYLYGTINNTGTFTLNGVGNATELRLVTPVVTLTGGGAVVFGTAGNNYIFGNGGALNELDNVNNTISGVGNLGNNQMALVNETAGVINANQAGQLVLDANGGVTNTGLLEATNTGGLFILNTAVDNSQNGNAGKISAIGAGAHVDLQSTTITGGTLTTSGTGAVIDVVANQNVTFDGSTLVGTGVAAINIAAGAAILVNNNANLYLRGVINNAGVITLGADAHTNATELRINSPIVTLQGGGVIQFSNSANNYIFDNEGSAETLNNVDNKIQGSGNIGNGNLTLINGKKGVIDANQAPGVAGSGLPGQLVLNCNGGVTNNGTIEATVAVGAPKGTLGGDLFILNTTVNDTAGGKIVATGVGSTIDLQNTTIQGGSVAASKGGLIDVVANQGATLDGSVKQLSLSGGIKVNNNAALALAGAIKNSGVITLNAAANVSDLVIVGANVTLSGRGKITLNDNANNRIFTNSGFSTFTNVDNTIQGGGNLGAGRTLLIANQTAGVINANVVSALTIQTAGGVNNIGTLESNTSVTNAGGLFILNTSVNNTGNGNAGKIIATGATGHVDLQSTNIYGGTLSTTGGGLIDVVSGQAVGFHGELSAQPLNIAAGSIVTINNNSTLYLYGVINNAGTLNESSTGNTTDIRLNSPVVTLTGGGALTLTANTNNRIVQNQGSSELNNVNNTISGAGQIGAGGSMFLVNGGVINATGAGGIAINLGGYTTDNSGTLQASTNSTLSVTNSVYNSGKLIANNGVVTVGGNVTGTGTETIIGTGRIEIGQSSGPVAAQAVSFAANSTGVFKIDLAQSFTGTVAGLATGATIDLGNVNIATASFKYAGSTTSGTLTVTDGTITANIALLGNYTQSNFHLTNDGANHTDVTYTGTGHAPVGHAPVGHAPVANAFVAAMASFHPASTAAASAFSASHHQAASTLAIITARAA